MKNMLLDQVANLSDIATLFSNVMKTIVGPIISIVGVIGVIYAIKLGIDYAKAEDAEGRKKVQGRLIGACVGVVIIIAGVVLCFALNWGKIYENFAAVDYSKTTGYISALLRR